MLCFLSITLCETGRSECRTLNFIMNAIKVPENTVIYRIYPCNKSDLSNSSIGSDALELIAENCIHKISGFLNRYIWQNESFNLSVVNSCGEYSSLIL